MVGSYCFRNKFCAVWGKALAFQGRYAPLLPVYFPLRLERTASTADLKAEYCLSASDSLLLDLDCCLDKASFGARRPPEATASLLLPLSLDRARSAMVNEPLSAKWTILLELKKCAALFVTLKCTRFSVPYCAE